VLVKSLFEPVSVSWYCSVIHRDGVVVEPFTDGVEQNQLEDLVKLHVRAQ
jgi:hypothetical protein